MAKDKLSSNPMDVLRKKARKRELKKQKDVRNQGKIVKSAKGDTSHLEAELRKLQSLEKDGRLDKAGKTKRKRLEEELESIKSVRQKLGISSDSIRNQGASSSTSINTSAVKDPKRSIHYHPIYNPSGAPPPGATYKEIDSSHSSSEKEDEDEEEGERDLSHIPLPTGPAPGESQIYAMLDLPEVRNSKAPKPKPTVTEEQVQPHSIPMPHHMRYPPPRPGAFAHQPPPLHPAFLPPGLPHPPIPLGIRPPPVIRPPPGVIHPPFIPPHPPFTRPPPGVMPRPPSLTHHSAPMQPALQPRVVTSTVVSAAPHIRDLQKELTQLVPASLLRKKTAGSASSAPPLAPKPAPAPASASDAGSSKKSNSNVEDDYDSFMKSIQGL